MSTTAVQEIGIRFCNWIARTATVYHLWCAEHVLRLADTTDMPDSLREARARNLDLLRDYRRRGEFPRHQHGGVGGVPCFIDAEGRQCAVACLMHASGNNAAALKISHDANFARIAEMCFPELGDWASHSGFTKAELARIQPAYPGDPPRWEDLQYAYELVYVVWAVGAFAALSIIANSLRLFVAYGGRFATGMLGILLGFLLLGLSFQVQLHHADPFHLIDDMMTFRRLAAVIGTAAVIFAVISLFLRRARPEAPDNPDSKVPPAEPVENTGIKEMKGWN
jgi:hypothetical protein